jgi:exoribonuclease R
MAKDKEERYSIPGLSDYTIMPGRFMSSDPHVKCYLLYGGGINTRTLQSYAEARKQIHADAKKRLDETISETQKKLDVLLDSRAQLEGDDEWAISRFIGKR